MELLQNVTLHKHTLQKAIERLQSALHITTTGSEWNYERLQEDPQRYTIPESLRCSECFNREGASIKWEDVNQVNFSITVTSIQEGTAPNFKLLVLFDAFKNFPIFGEKDGAKKVIGRARKITKVIDALNACCKDEESCHGITHVVCIDIQGDDCNRISAIQRVIMAASGNEMGLTEKLYDGMNHTGNREAWEAANNEPLDVLKNYDEKSCFYKILNNERFVKRDGDKSNFTDFWLPKVDQLIRNRERLSKDVKLELSYHLIGHSSFGAYVTRFVAQNEGLNATALALAPSFYMIPFEKQEIKNVIDDGKLKILCAYDDEDVNDWLKGKESDEESDEEDKSDESDDDDEPEIKLFGVRGVETVPDTDHLTLLLNCKEQVTAFINAVKTGQAH